MNVCGNCKHWVASGTRSLIVGDPQQGECRWGPPGWTIVAQPNGQAHKITSYSVVHDKWPACGRFELAVVPASNGSM